MASQTQTAHISSIVSEIDSATKAIHDGEEEIKKARKRALLAARNLVNTLEDPMDAIFRHAFSGPDRVCVRLGVELRLFRGVVGGGGRPVSAAELAKAAESEQLLIVRIMRILAAMRFVDEAGPENYTPNAITRTMTTPPVEAGVKSTFGHSFQVFANLPAYFNKNGYKCPTDILNTPFQFGMNTELGFFDWIEEDTKYFKNFQTFMEASRRMRPIFVDWFPVQEHIINGYIPGNHESGDDVLLVDIGGGRGRDLQVFRNRFPQAPGRMILEDRPLAVAEANFTAANMEAIAHDFFTPQPIKGARIYFMSQILHDWPDHLASNILRNIASAMKPGYSKVMLSEYILPATGCPLHPSFADFHMMTCLAGAERTEKQWHELAASAGMKVDKFWYPENSFDGVIEMILDESAGASNSIGPVEKTPNGVGAALYAGETNGVGATNGIGVTNGASAPNGHAAL